MIRALLALVFLALPVDLLSAQWETSQGGNGRRDGFVDTSGPAFARPGWYIDLRTQDPLQPIVGDGKVFFAHSPDWMSENGATLSAADLDTGEVLWSATLPIGDGLHPTPQAYRDGVVYAMPTAWYLNDEFLYALDADTGALLWQSEAPIQAHFYTPRRCSWRTATCSRTVATSPLAAGG
jgi:outer membrane protein assembly factor BamB